MNTFTYRSRQRGVAALAVSVLLLFGMTLIAFFVNRGMLFEQKTSANQYRSTRAFEVAEAGLEWSLAMLNDTRGVDATCTPAPLPKKFRKKFIPTNVARAFVPTPGTFAACLIRGSSATDAGTLVCSCPDTAIPPTLPTSDEPRFSVYFSSVAGEPFAVQVTAFGCVGTGTLCESTAGIGSFDAKSIVAVTLKPLALMPALPMAALTAGRDVKIEDLGFENLDPATNGLLVHAGGNINAKKKQMRKAQSLPGRPALDSMIENDPALNGLFNADKTGDAMFRRYFGMPVTEFAAMDRTVTITKGAAELQYMYAQGATTFYVTSDIKYGNLDIGTPDRPVIIVLDRGNKPRFEGKGTLYGLLYQNDDDWDVGDHDGNVNGAVITRGDIRTHGGHKDTDWTYDAEVLRNLTDITSNLVRVPGSWRDFPAAP